MKLLELPPALRNAARYFGFFDDFFHYTTTEGGTSIVGDSGTIAASDAAGGVIVITPSDGTVADNDQSIYKGTQELYKFADDKPLTFESRVQFTEAATNAANVWTGFINAAANDDLADNGAGVRANFYGCLLYKVDGGTKWKFTSSMGTTQATNTSSTVAGGAAYQRVRIEVECPTPTEIVCTPFVDGVALVDDVSGLPIQHRLTIATATEMQVTAGCKNGSTTLETLNVDYIGCWQVR